MVFLEFFYEAFGMGVIPIGFGILIFLLILLFILVSIVKAIFRKIFNKPNEEKAPTYTKQYSSFSSATSSTNYSEQQKRAEIKQKETVKIPESVEIKPEFSIKDELKVLALELSKEKYEQMRQLIKKADSGDVESQCECGRLYMNGYIVSKDESKALYWYEKAAEQDSVEGHFQIGEYYADTFYDDETFPCFEKARRHLVIAAKENHKTSQESLAMAYCHKYTQYCEEKGLVTKEEREADPVYMDYLKKYKYWEDMFYTYNGIFAKEYIKSEQNFIE